MAKAGRPKKGSAGLPSWFDIEKYRGFKDFGAVDWYQQLIIRYYLNTYLECEYEVADATTKQYWREIVALLKEHPILTEKRIVAASPERITVKGKQLIKLNDVFRTLIDAISNQFSGIHDATNRVLFEACQAFPDDIVHYLSGNLEYAGRDGLIIRRLGSTLEQTMHVHDFLNQKYDQGNTTFTAIDLSLPDQVLIAEFREYLKTKRKKHPRPETVFFKNPDFTSWYNNGCLAYLDLVLLDFPAEEIRWSVFGEALNTITDKPVGGENTLAKTCKKLSANLLEMDTIRILESQTAREKAGLLQKSGKLLVR